MKKYIFEGKTREEVINKGLAELKITEENAIINILEEKQGLLKKNVKIEIININDVITHLKECLETITSLMNIKINLEVRRRDKNIEINIFSDNNAILIGKDGRILESLNNIMRQILLKEANEEYKIQLDVENYKNKRITNLERLAKKVAREVKQTKVATKLDRMNSYERRIIHNTLANNKYVYTESTGEEPNRCIVIKPKEN